VPSAAVARLLDRPANSRLVLVREGYWTPSDVTALADRAFRGRFHSGPEMRDLSELALRMSRGLPDTRRGREARAKALAISGNVQRIEGNYPQAEKLLLAATQIWEAEPRSARLGAQIHEFRASLFEARRLFGAAMLELDEATDLRVLAGMNLASIHLQRGIVLAYQGSVAAAIRQCKAAIAETRDPIVIRAAILSSAWCYTEAEHPAGASDLLLRSRSFLAAGPAQASLRVPWLEARIADLTGASAGAECQYLQARQALAEARRPHEAGLCSLDLSLLYRRTSRLVEAVLAGHQAGTLLKAVALGDRTEAMAADTLCQVTLGSLDDTLRVCVAALLPIRTAVVRRKLGQVATTVPL
jgi:tetratricopeptide (TPR) repeat protein